MTTRDRLLVTGNIVLVIAVGGMMFSNVVRFTESRRPPEPLDVVSYWQQYALRGARIGHNAGRVTVMEFVDYKCGVCRAFVPILDDMLASTGGEVSLVIRHFPFLEPESHVAARAAVCADRSGKLAEYHNILLKEPVLATDSLVSYAIRGGIGDSANFRRCIDSAEAAAVVALDLSDAVALGVEGTPTTFVNGEKYVGAQPLLRKIVAQHLRARRGKSATPGPQD